MGILDVVFPWGSLNETITSSNNRVCFSRHKENDKADVIWRGEGYQVLHLSQVLQKSQMPWGRNAVCWEGSRRGEGTAGLKGWHSGGTVAEVIGMRWTRGNRELGRQMFPKDHPEGVGDPDLPPSTGVPHAFWHMRESQDLGLKKDLKG